MQYCICQDGVGFSIVTNNPHIPMDFSLTYMVHCQPRGKPCPSPSPKCPGYWRLQCTLCYHNHRSRRKRGGDSSTHSLSFCLEVTHATCIHIPGPKASHMASLHFRVGGELKSYHMPEGELEYACMLCCAQALGRVRLSVTPWTVARQAPLSMGILQGRILKWVAMSSSRGFSQPRDRILFSLIVGRFFTSEPPGKPKNTVVSSLSVLQETFPTQESNQGHL